MKIVVDTSVAVKWFVEEPFRAEAVALLDGDDELLAPDLILAEVANALWRKVRKSEIDVSQSKQAIEDVGDLLDLKPTKIELTAAAFDYARLFDHSVYDCIFLACAVQEQAQLVTADAAFVSKLSKRDIWPNVRVLV